MHLFNCYKKINEPSIVPSSDKIEDLFENHIKMKILKL